jgi:hypothetical protein
MANSNFRHIYTDTIDKVIAPKNYISNAFARENINGWATYANSAANIPSSGTGGSPTVTLVRNTSAPLRNEADFLLTKDAANRQGEGVSFDFTLDVADKSKLITVSFDYLGSSNFVPGSSSDIQVFLYDITGTTLIPLTNIVLNTLSGSFSGDFKSSNNTSYRLIFHIATTNALAYTLEFTNVVVSQLITEAILSLQEIPTPSNNPPVGTEFFYIKPNGLLYTKNSSGIEIVVGGTANGFELHISNIINTSASNGSTTFTTFTNSPAFTFTPVVSGKYKIYCPANLYQGNAGAESYAIIQNTAGGASLLAQNIVTIFASSAILATNCYIQSVYNLVSGNSYTFDIQGRSSVAATDFELLGSGSAFYMFAELCG